MKPTLAVFVADTQCGGTTALGLPGFEVIPDVPFSLSRDQEWLLECWNDALARVKAAAVGHQVFVGFGGDSVDGANHHGSTQTEGGPGGQVAMAVELYRPYLNLADECRALAGTDEHTGDNGDADRIFARELGVQCRNHWELHVAGRLLDWAHHGITVAQNVVSENNGMKLAADKVYWRCKEKGRQVPDAIIRHHAHRSPRPIEWRGIRVAVGGCWQLSTSYGHKIAAGSPPDIGLLLWWPETNRIERILYDVPRRETILEFRDGSRAAGGSPSHSGVDPRPPLA